MFMFAFFMRIMPLSSISRLSCFTSNLIFVTIFFLLQMMHFFVSRKHNGFEKAFSCIANCITTYVVVQATPTIKQANFLVEFSAATPSLPKNLPFSRQEKESQIFLEFLRFFAKRVAAVVHTDLFLLLQLSMH